MKTLQSEQGTIVKRAADARGTTDFGWLHGRHSFSFGEYYDPAQMGFRSLRVINDDIVEPGAGFPAHPHRDAEIFSYVVEGELAHKDSMGNGSVIRAGNLQYMSAGSGVTHSEFNPSKTSRTHLYQIWLKPNESGGAPRYAEKKLEDTVKANALTLLFAPTERDGAIAIRQDAEIYFGKLSGGQSLPVAFGAERHAWIQMIRGELKVLGETLRTGDGAAVSNSPEFMVTAEEDSEFLLFNLA